MTEIGDGPVTDEASRNANGVAPRALILMYHRVAHVSADPWGLCVTPQHFAEQMEVLRSCSRPAGLQELTDALATDTVADRTVVVTLDDGYADNLYNARPLLFQHGIPATVFITTGTIGSCREFWWDEIEHLILHPGFLPEKLELNVNGRLHRWDVATADYNSTESRHQFAGWRAWETPPDGRTALYRSVWGLFQPLPDEERQAALQQLRDWAGGAATARPDQRTLFPDEVVTLAKGDLIEIGAHTVTHPMLAGLRPEVQVEEVQKSKDDLEAIVGHSITQFSYPYGNYADETLAIVRNAGLTCACATTAGPVAGGADPFALPRNQVHDWDGEQFSKWLTQMQNGK